MRSLQITRCFLAVLVVSALLIDARGHSVVEGACREEERACRESAGLDDRRSDTTDMYAKSLFW